MSKTKAECEAQCEFVWDGNHFVCKKCGYVLTKKVIKKALREMSAKIKGAGSHEQ